MLTFTHLLVLPGHNKEAQETHCVPCGFLVSPAARKFHQFILCFVPMGIAHTFPLLVFCAFDNKASTWQL